MRFIVIVLLQVLVLQRMSVEIGGFSYMHFLVYPVFILLLPINTPRVLVMLLAFGTGLVVDAFYSSPGVHAAAAVVLGYMRSYVIRILEPYEGYSVDDSPSLSKMGVSWFMSYLAITLGIFLFTYFSIEAFSFVYIFDILMDSIFSFIVSFLLILIGQFVFASRS